MGEELLIEQEYSRRRRAKQKITLGIVWQVLYYTLLSIMVFLLGAYLVSGHLIDSALTDDVILTYRQVLKLVALLSSVMLSIYLSKEVEKSFFIKFGFSYFIYWLVSYSLLLTQNINNESFSASEFLTNQFFELGPWKFVVAVINLAFLLHWLVGKYPRLEKFQNCLVPYTKPNLGLSLLLSLIALRDSKLLENLVKFLYLDNIDDFNIFLIAQSYKLLLIILTISLVTFLFWRAVDGMKDNKSTLSLTLVTSLGLAVIFNYFVQYGIQSDTDYLGHFIFPGATLFQIIVFTLLNLTVYTLTNRYWLSTLLIIFTGTAFSIANQTKFAMRSEPILWTDLTMLSQLDVIMDFVETSLLVLAIVLILGFIALYFFFRNRYLKGKIFNLLWKRIILMLSLVGTFTGIYNYFSGQTSNHTIPVLTRLNKLMNIDFEGHAVKARYQSLSYVWVQQIAKPVMDIPENYSEEAIKSIVAKYTERAEEINKTRKQSISDETVIFILSESLSDPTRVDGVTLTENVLSNILDIKEETTSGLMRADNYGGGTANMETQSLVGLPLYNLSAYIYNVEVIPKLSYLPSISDRFAPENKYVIHLGGTQIYSRADVYNRLHFGTFIADDTNATQPTENIKYGGFPSDASTYQNILDNLDATESQFFSVITYQNHVPWSMSEPESISGVGEGFSDKENERLSHYARLLYQTDSDTKDFLEKLSKIDKKITVVFYGDHLPGFYPESAFKNNPDSKYLTDYFIWSNKEENKKDYPYLNSSDFPAALLAHTSSKVSPYYALLTEVLENASVGVTDWTEENKLIAEELKLIQYDLISGRGYLNKQLEFFEFID